MHERIFQVTLEVAIGWDHHKVFHRRRNFCLKLDIIVSCQGSWMLLCYQVWFKFRICQVFYSLLLQVLFLMFQRSFYPDVHHRLLWKNRFSCLRYLVSMKYLYCLLGFEMKSYGAASQILHQILHLVNIFLFEFCILFDIVII